MWLHMMVVPTHHAILEGTPPASASEPHESRACPRSFEAIYTAYFQHVVRWVRAFGCPAADIEDVAQETFLVARRRLPELQVTNVAGWLYRVAQRATHQHRRKVWVARVLHLEPDLQSEAAEGGPVEALEQREARRQMHGVLSRMTDRRRTTFFLFEIEGYTGEEIASLEGVSVNTIYTRLHHARREFMRLLAEDEGLEVKQ